MRLVTIFLSLFLFLCGIGEAKTRVLVSIAPQKFLVEKIGGEHVDVTIIVPPGANAHTYEPSPKQSLSLQQTDLWFRLGESFETRLLTSLQHKILIVDQREGLDLIQSGVGCCHIGSADPHIWLSPRLLQQQAAQIERALIQHDPLHATYYTSHADSLREELERLDADCSTCFALTSKKPILVSHPAFGYFCRDYGLTQLAIEMEGREPAPRYLTQLLQQAHSAHIQHVFVQRQHTSKGSRKLARDLHATVVYIDPYEENVISNIWKIANLFADTVNPCL